MNIKICILCGFIQVKNGKWRKATPREKDSLIGGKIVCRDCKAIVHAPTNTSLNIL